MDYERGRRDLQQMICKFQETEDSRQKLQNWINHFNNPNIGKRTGKLVPFTTNLDELFPSSDSSDNEDDDDDVETPTPMEHPGVKPTEPVKLPEPDFPASNDSTPRIQEEIETSACTQKLALEGTRDGSFTANYEPGSLPHKSPLVKTKVLKKRLFTSTGHGTKNVTGSFMNNTDKDDDTSAQKTDKSSSNKINSTNTQQDSQERKSQVADATKDNGSHDKTKSIDVSSNRKTRRQTGRRTGVSKKSSTTTPHANDSTADHSEKQISTNTVNHVPDMEVTNDVTRPDDDTTLHRTDPKRPSSIMSEESDIDDFFDDNFIIESITKEESAKFRRHQLTGPKNKSPPTVKRKTKKKSDALNLRESKKLRNKSKSSKELKTSEKGNRLKSVSPQPDATEESLNHQTILSSGKEFPQVEETTLPDKEFEEAAQFTVAPMTPQEKESVRRMGMIISRSSTLGARMSDDPKATARRRAANKSKNTLSEETEPVDNSVNIPTHSRRKNRKQRILDEPEDEEVIQTDNWTKAIVSDEDTSVKKTNVFAERSSRKITTSNDVDKKKSSQKGKTQTKKRSKRSVPGETAKKKTAIQEDGDISPKKRMRKSIRDHQSHSSASVENSSLQQWLSTTSNEASHTKERISINKESENTIPKKRSRGRPRKVRRQQPKVEEPTQPKIVTPSTKFNPFKEPFLDNRNLVASGPIKRRFAYDPEHSNNRRSGVPDTDEVDSEHVAFPLTDQSTIINPHASSIQMPKSRLMGPPASTPRHSRAKKATKAPTPENMEDSGNSESIASESEVSLDNNIDTYADNEELVLTDEDKGIPVDSEHEKQESNTKESNITNMNKDSRSRKSMKAKKNKRSEPNEDVAKPKKSKKKQRLESDDKKNKSGKSKRNSAKNVSKSSRVVSRRNLFYNIIPNQLVNPSDDATPGVRRSRRVRTKPLHRWCGEEFEYDDMGNIVGIHGPVIPLRRGERSTTGEKIHEKQHEKTEKNLPKINKKSKELNLKSDKRNKKKSNVSKKEAKEKSQNISISQLSTPEVAEHDEVTSDAQKKSQSEVSVNVATEQSVNESDGKERLTTANKLNRTTYSVIDQTQVIEVGANKLISVPQNEVVFHDPLEGAEKLTYTKGLTNKAVAMGRVTIPPGQQKGMSCMNHMLCFHLNKGRVEVFLCDNWSVLAPNSYFIVPGGNGYDIRNISKEHSAELVFTQVKAKTQGMVFQ